MTDQHWLQKYKDLAEAKDAKDSKDSKDSKSHEPTEASKQSHEGAKEHVDTERKQKAVHRRAAFESNRPRDVHVSGKFGRPQMTEGDVTHIQAVPAPELQPGQQPGHTGDQLHPGRKEHDKLASLPNADHAQNEQIGLVHEAKFNPQPGDPTESLLDKIKHTFQGGELFGAHTLLADNSKGLPERNDQFLRDPADMSSVGAGWNIVDMKTAAPPVNQVLQDMPVNDYNCKYYLKTYIEGHKPHVKNSSNCEIEKGYMEQHGYHKEPLKGIQDLKDGDVVMVKALDDGQVHLSPVMHVAIVQRDAQGHIYLIQKPDDIHPVQRCSIQDFANHFRVKIPGPQIDVYTH